MSLGINTLEVGWCRSTSVSPVQRLSSHRLADCPCLTGVPDGWTLARAPQMHAREQEPVVTVTVCPCARVPVFPNYFVSVGTLFGGGSGAAHPTLPTHPHAQHTRSSLVQVGRSLF